MEMKKLVLNSREALIEQAFNLAWKKFEEFKKTKEYKDILIKQVIFISPRARGKELHSWMCIKAIPLRSDADTLKQIEKETNKKGLTIEIREVDRDLGGVIVHEKDGKISVDNTFASILERKKNETRVKVSEILFE